MKNLALPFVLLLLASAPAPGQAPAPTEQEAKAFHAELTETLKRKDRAALERMLADGFFFVHSTGGLETRKQYLDRAAAGALASQRSEFNTLEEQWHVYDGRTALRMARGSAQTPSGELILRSINVYVKVDGRWQWASSQSTRLPSRPKAAAIDRGLYSGYAGRYEVSPERVLTVSQEGETLRALFTGFQPAELIPRSETEFAWFNPEVNTDAQLLFVKDESGRVTHAVYRREGDEVWRAKRVR